MPSGGNDARNDPLRRSRRNAPHFISQLSALEGAYRTWKDTPDSAKSDALLMGASLTQAQSWRAKRGQDLPATDREFIDLSTKRESKARARARHIQALVYVLLVGRGHLAALLP
jgi:hypothetical protein